MYNVASGGRGGGGKWYVQVSGECKEKGNT